MGCAVGRSTFELAREFDEVVGIDYSKAFIQRCQQLKMTGRSAYKLITEGVLREEKVATVHPDIVGPSLPLSLSFSPSLPLLLPLSPSLYPSPSASLSLPLPLSVCLP